MLKLVKFHRPPPIKVFGVRGADRNVMERMVEMPRMAPQYVFINVRPDNATHPQGSPR